MLIWNVHKRWLKRNNMAYILTYREWRTRDNKRRKSKQAEEKK